MVSVNLANTGHYDIDDLTSLGIFTQQKIKNQKAVEQYLLFPNLEINGVSGLVIDLWKGAIVEWDGHYIWHCSTCAASQNTGKVFGLMIGDCTETSPVLPSRKSK